MPWPPDRWSRSGARGEFTRELLAWAGRAGASITAIKAEPPPELLGLSDAYPELQLGREPSLEALSQMPAPRGRDHRRRSQLLHGQRELRVIEEREAFWAGAVAEIVAPWDRNPIMERLEAGVSRIVDRVRLDRQDELLRALLRSPAFALAERLSRLRQHERRWYRASG